MCQGTINTSQSSVLQSSATNTTQRSRIREEGRGGKQEGNKPQSKLFIFVFPSHLSTCLSYLSSVVSFSEPLSTHLSLSAAISCLFFFCHYLPVFALLPPYIHLPFSIHSCTPAFSLFVSYAISSSQSTTSSIYIRDCVIGCCKNTD